MKFRTAIILSLSFLIIPFLLYFSIFHGQFSTDDQNWANFGSYIGGIVSSIFSYLSFIMVLIIFYQSKEDKNKTEIDDRIFKYLDLLNSCYNKIEVNISNNKVKGEAVFSIFSAESFSISELIENDKLNKENNNISKKIMLLAFYRNSILEYFDLINIIIKYIDQKGYQRKNEYISLLVSQMSEQQKNAFAILKYSVLDENKFFKEYAYKNTPIDGFIKIGKTIDNYSLEL